jgi:hypothetical protein
MRYDENPFPEGDPDRRAIWDMIVRRDIDAYIAKDWAMVANDFVADGFFVIDCHRSGNPDSWRLVCPRLDDYRDMWLSQTIDQADYAEELRPALFRLSILRDIEIEGDKALARKKFDGVIKRKDGSDHKFKWQSVAVLQRHDGVWRFVGGIGYLPNPISL